MPELVDIVLHLDQHVASWATALGPVIYLLLATIVFLETGVVITPFLPGDSLLFAAGAVAALPGSAIDPALMAVVLIGAAIAGDAVNYAVGRWFGEALLARRPRWLNLAYVERAQTFYVRHGGKTIVLARFVPIVRTFAPFVAGVGRMGYRRFATYNVVGAVVWVVGFIALGYAFGNLPAIKRHFQLVVLAIIVISVLPVALETLRARRRSAVSPS